MAGLGPSTPPGRSAPEHAVAIVLAALAGHRAPEPLRRTRQAARRGLSGVRSEIIPVRRNGMADKDVAGTGAQVADLVQD